jgi:hypothetical protein
MNIITKFQVAVQHAKLLKRDSSNSEIARELKVELKKISNLKKEFKINSLKMVREINKIKDSKKILILDYVLIEHKMLIINKPYNQVYNPSTRRLEDCIVMLVAIININGNIYPIKYDFWISDLMIEEDEVYMSKVDISIVCIEELLKLGLVIDEIIFDAGFNTKKMLAYLESKKMLFVTRQPKTRKMKYDNKRMTSKDIFKDEYNGKFYYYDKHGFLNHRTVEYAQIEVQLVVVAQKKDDLVNRDFFCIISNSKTNTYTEIYKSYKLRSSIETFFKQNKSYLALRSFNGNNQDKIESHVNLCFASYMLIQRVSREKKLTFYKTVLFLKTLSNTETDRQIRRFWNELSELFEISTFDSLDYLLTINLKHFIAS